MEEEGLTRLLIVEDSAILQRRLVTAFSEFASAAIVGCAETATDAIALVSKAAPDVVTVDLALREGTGFEVMRALQQLPAHARPVYVVLSTSSDAVHHAEARRLGASAVFDKTTEIGQCIDFVGSFRPSSSSRAGADEQEAGSGSYPAAEP